MSTPGGPWPRLITGPEFARALEAAGVITGGLDGVERIVIVAEPSSVVQVHVQRAGDERILAVASLLVPDEVPPGEDGPFITRPAGRPATAPEYRKHDQILPRMDES